MSLPRVLLIHANPMQEALPVPAYGLERLATAVADRAEVEIIDPYLTAKDAEAETRAVLERLEPDLVGLGVRVVEDCIVIDDLGGESSSDVHSFLPEIKALVETIRRQAPETPVVVGGSAFSYFPQEMLDYLEVEWGVVGAGEETFSALVERLGDEEGWLRLPGVVKRGESKGLGEALQLGFSPPTRRDPRYAPVTRYPVRTRIGCAMACSYCLTANMSRRHENNELGRVLDEIEDTVRLAEEHGLRKTPLFFADDEFNLPEERHAVALLEGIVARGLAGKIHWRAYFNPTPLSDELAALIAETNGQVSLTVDTAAETVMERNGKPFRRRHLESATETLAAHEIESDYGFVFGLPGESEETIADSVAFIRSLPAGMEACYSSGARVYPYTPLSRLALEDPERLTGPGLDDGFLSPAVYSSPWPAREIARRLAAEFADLEHVYPVGVGFVRAQKGLGHAYRVLAGGSDDWDGVLAEASAGGYRQSGEAVVSLSLQLALWYERYDLAAAACRTLRRLPDRKKLSLPLLWLTQGICSWKARSQRNGRKL
jgi:radical SAM superfamily enzyme YgiQ (UPF0313 family)